MFKRNTRSIVLKSIKYKDADKIYTVYSKDLGKILVAGKGVRKISSRRAGNLDTLNVVDLGLHETTNGFKIITEAKAVESFGNLKKNLEVSKQAYYIANLIQRFIEEEHVDVVLFNLLIDIFRKLDSLANVPVDSKVEAAILDFEINFMRLLGYELCLDKCSICGDLLSEGWVKCGFDFDKGGLVCPKHPILIRLSAPGISSALMKRYMQEKLGGFSVEFF